MAGNYPVDRVRVRNNYAQPFWLPASTFYVLATAIAIAVFFITWGILLDEGETPWIPAGVFASLILIGAVILREVVLRRRRNQLLWAQERLDHNLNKVYRQTHNPPDENKLTLEKNATILKQIKQKSEAANVLGKLAEAHWEVFELCDEYLQQSEKELQTIRVGSPRLSAINHGRQNVQELHKFHLLAWSAAESRGFIQEAKASATISTKLEIATKALNTIDSAIEYYPDEETLIESANAVKEFIASIKVSHWIEQAERSAFKGNYKRAISHYRDALFYLARENVQAAEKELIAGKINFEIDKLNKMSGARNEVDAQQQKKILDNE
jgi:hypothetical protein